MASLDTKTRTFLRQRRRLEALAAQVLRDSEEARDVASETLVALLENGPDHDDAIPMWLNRSAVNRAIDRVRARERARDRAHLAAPETFAPEHRDHVGQAQAGALVRAAMERLRPRDRLALEMRHVAGSAYGEIGARLNTTAPHARIVTHRAAQRLRREMVAMLAGHHGAPDECVRRLVRGVTPPEHPGCAPCGAVADELAALTTPAMPPMVSLPLADRLASYVSRAATRVRMPRSPATGKVAEALGALVLATSIAVPPALPATSRAVAAGPSRITAVAPGVRGAPHAVRASIDRAATSRAGSLGNVLVRQDDSSDDVVRRQRESVGLSLALLDAIDGSLASTQDLVRLEIATTYTEGAPTGLLMRFGTRAERRRTDSLSVGWTFRDTDCRGSFGIALDHYLDITCTDQSRQPPDGMLVDVRHSGTTLEVSVRFSDMVGGAQFLMRPGAILDRITAQTSPMPGSYSNAYGDIAPDYGAPGLTYRIPR